MTNGNPNIFALLLLICFINPIISTGLDYPLVRSPLDWHVNIMYVNASEINIFSAQDEYSEVIGQFSFMQKILVIEDPGVHVKYGWRKVLYQRKGL